MYTEMDLIVLMFDLFLAANETTTNTLIWATYYLAGNPEVQSKMQAEIDRELPQGTQVSLHDKTR